MIEKYKFTISYDIDFEKFQSDYPNLYWLDEVLKLHGFLEVYDFEYVFTIGYQTDNILSEKEMQTLFQKLTAHFPWLVDCTTRFDCLDLGEPKDITYLFKKNQG